MVETKEKTIEGTTYRVRQLDAVKGRKVVARLIRLLSNAAAGGDDALSKIFASVTEEDMDYFCDVFAASTDVNYEGKWPCLKDVFGLHFAGKYGEMMQWLLFCVEVNFGNFLGETKPATESPAKAS